MKEKFSSIMVGEWITGKAMNGELIQGFIESVDPYFHTVKVTVVESDNHRIIGKTITTLQRNVSLLPNITIRQEEAIRELIDLALSTNDKEWFDELLPKLTGGTETKVPSISNKRIKNNRLDSYRV